MTPRLRLLAAAAALAAACGGNPQPKPPDPPRPPAPRVVQLTVWTATDPTAALRVDDFGTSSCYYRRIDADGGKVYCDLAEIVPAPYGAHLTVAADGFLPQTIDFALAAAFPQEIDGVRLEAVPKDAPWLPRLARDGQFLRAGGARWTGIGATDFDLLEQFLNGGEAAIAPVLAQRAHPWGDDRAGFTLLRVWTAFNVCPDGNCPPSNQRIGRVVPRERGDLYDQLRRLARVASNYGLYLELTAFTGNFAEAFSGDAERVAHWEGLIGVCTDSPNVILDLQNEWDHPAMRGFNAAPFREPPAPCLASRGSGQADSSPYLPVWSQLATYHPGFGDEWPRKAVHNGMEDVGDKFGIAVLVDEMTRFPDGDSNPQHAYDVGRGCALLVAGCVFHSVHGKGSAPWDGAELPLAQRWVEGARSLPLDCQAGGYRHLSERENDQIIRSYIRGGDPACIVDVHH
jgi:hypothetical protein